MHSFEYGCSCVAVYQVSHWDVFVSICERTPFFLRRQYTQQWTLWSARTTSTERNQTTLSSASRTCSDTLTSNYLAHIVQYRKHYPNAAIVTTYKRTSSPDIKIEVSPLSPISEVHNYECRRIVFLSFVLTICKCEINIRPAADVTILVLQEKAGLLFCCTSIRSLVHARATGSLWQNPAYRHTRGLNISNIWCLHIQSISSDVCRAETAQNIDRAWDMGYPRSLAFPCLCILPQLSKWIFQRK